MFRVASLPAPYHPRFDGADTALRRPGRLACSSVAGEAPGGPSGARFGTHSVKSARFAFEAAVLPQDLGEPVPTHRACVPVSVECDRDARAVIGMRHLELGPPSEDLVPEFEFLGGQWKLNVGIGEHRGHRSVRPSSRQFTGVQLTDPTTSLRSYPTMVTVQHSSSSRKNTHCHFVSYVRTA